MMHVPNCHMCDSNAQDKARFGDSGLDEGEYCPCCFRPFCKHHGGVVRWRWKATREVDSGIVCRECKRTYKHRNWDAANRDWIS
jgi:hypothetical protein